MPDADRSDRPEKPARKDRAVRSHTPRVNSGSRPPENLRSGWEVMLAGDLTDKQSDLLNDLIDVPPRSRGTIYFDSCGGSLYVGLSLAALIRMRGLDATGVVLGECSSAALMPLAACKRRLVMSHSTLLFHRIGGTSEEQIDLDQAVEWARHFRWLEADNDALLARMFGIPLETLQAWTRPGRFVTGEEMVAAGIATAIDPFSAEFDSRSVLPSRQPRE